MPCRAVAERGDGIEEESKVKHLLSFVGGSAFRVLGLELGGVK